MASDDEESQNRARASYNVDPSQSVERRVSYGATMDSADSHDNITIQKGKGLVSNEQEESDYVHEAYSGSQPLLGGMYLAFHCKIRGV